MLACAESNFLKFKLEYLCENEFLRKTILACLSGAQMGSINKNRGRKSRDSAPLKKSTDLNSEPDILRFKKNTLQFSPQFQSLYP